MVNGNNKAFLGSRVKVTVYDIQAKEKSSQVAILDIPADSSVRALQLLPLSDISRTYFLKLELADSSMKPLSDNFYWLSTKPDKLDWVKKLDTVYTPQSAYADLSGLDTLPEVTLVAHGTLSQEGNESVVCVAVENPSSSLAFMVHLRVTKPGSDEDVVPIFWDDNYVSLLPGEKRELSAQFETGMNNTGGLVLTVDGWNVAPASLPLVARQ